MVKKEKYELIPLLPQSEVIVRWHELFVLKVKVIVKKIINLWKTKTTQQ